MNYRGKRQRRQAAMRLRSSGAFRVGHTAKTGRTGSIRSKLNPSKAARNDSHRMDNPPSVSAVAFRVGKR